MDQIIARNISCVRNGQTVFDNLSFELSKGQAMVVSGKNGSGKTSLLRQMAGLTPINSGTLSGVPDNGFYYISTQDITLPSASIYQTLLYWSKLYQSSPDIEAVCEAFNLTELQDTKTAHLSGGQRKRLNLARLLIDNRALWLLDEPENALDDISRSKLNTAIQNHLDTGGIAVIASHSNDLWPDHKLLDMDAFGINETRKEAA